MEFKKLKLSLLFYIIFSTVFILYQFNFLLAFDSKFNVSDIKHELGYAYISKLSLSSAPHWVEKRFKLYEDDILLSSSSSYHDYIRAVGNGSYDITNNYLRFSVRGNSNPMEHVFTIERPYNINSYILYLIITSSVGTLMYLFYLLVKQIHFSYMKTVIIRMMNILIIVLVLIGSSLLTIDIFGILIPPYRNAHANKVPSYASVLIELNKLVGQHSEQSITEEDLAKRVTHLFFVGIKHYWIVNESYDKTLAFYWWKNWLLFLILKCCVLDWHNMYYEQILSFFGRIDRDDTKLLLSRYEFINFKDALARGVGLCSQHALAVADFMQKIGYSSQVLKLNGHVISQITFSNHKQYILDADYDVWMPFDAKYARNHLAVVRKYYQNAGYSAHELDKILTAYTHPPLTIYQNQIIAIIRRLEFISWIIPVFLFLLSLLIFIIKRFINEIIDIKRSPLK